MIPSGAKVKRLTLVREGGSIILRAQIERSGKVSHMRLDRQDFSLVAHTSMRKFGIKMARRYSAPFSDEVALNAYEFKRSVYNV